MPVKVLYVGFYWRSSASKIRAFLQLVHQLSLSMNFVHVLGEPAKQRESGETVHLVEFVFVLLNISNIWCKIIWLITPWPSPAVPQH